jgi:hypothetical protein
MSELGGSEGDDAGADIRRSSYWDLHDEALDADIRGKLGPEEDWPHGHRRSGGFLSEDEFTEPADGPPSLHEQIDEIVLPEVKRSDHAERDKPQQDDSSGWDDLARDLKAFLKTAKDTPFTGDELDEVRAALRDAQEQIADLKSLNSEQLAMIRNLSGQLDRSSEHLGRKDWITLAIGAGTALVIAGVVPSLSMLHIGAKFFHEIYHLFD